MQGTIEEGNLKQAEEGGDNGEVKVITNPHPDLVPDLNGKWTMRKVVHPIPPALDLVVKVFKLFSPTRTCPIHGEVKVLDSHFDKSVFHGVEGLSCGHTLLISRRADGMKKSRLYYLKSEPRNWKFGGWTLVFKQTVINRL